MRLAPLARVQRIDMIGRTIGHYRILSQLGRGGSGIVYRAVDETLNREVAIKVLNPDAADPDAMKRFRAEATILAQLNHPGIATIYELFQSDTDLLMVMELVFGQTLDALSARQGPLLPDRAAHLVERMLAALQHAHRAGVVHRDLKPTNVMVTDAGVVKLMDFGIARIRGAERITLDGSMVGTPAYMAPEQVLGQEVDERSDLYSVGVIFYRLLTAMLPFDGDSPIALMQRQLAEAPTPLAARNRDLPGWCQAIVERALAKAPAERFQTASEFRHTVIQAAGIVTAPDLADALAMDDRTDGRMPPARIPTPTIVMPVANAADSASLAFRGSVTRLADRLAAASKSDARGWSVPAKLRALLRSNRYVALVIALVVAAALLKMLELQSPSQRTVAPSTVTPRTAARDWSERLVFETRTLVGTGRRQREREARMVLDDGAVTIALDEEKRPLHSVPYAHVTSINYSHGRDPMWRSPDGPALVARANGGILRSLGIPITRNWISLATDTSERFVVVSVGDGQVHAVLSALEQRTGLRAQRPVGREHNAD
jgi:serine/threonine-protein kinase